MRTNHNTRPRPSVSVICLRLFLLSMIIVGVLFLARPSWLPSPNAIIDNMIVLVPAPATTTPTIVLPTAKVPKPQSTPGKIPTIVVSQP
jgi:hypothetical protein